MDPGVSLVAEHRHAVSSWPNVRYSPSRFALVSTMSAVIRTVDSTLPLDCGSAGTQVTARAFRRRAVAAATCARRSWSRFRCVPGGIRIADLDGLWSPVGDAGRVGS